MGRALVVLVTATFVAAPPPAPFLVPQTSAPGQVTPARPLPPGATTAKGTAVIRGTVVAMDTGAPLRRVQISAFGNTPDARGTRVTSTDDQGRYELRELVAGRYTINASKAGFVSLQYGQRRPVERGTPVEVADGQVVDKVTLALPRGGVITGRISDDIGEPIAAVQVQAFRYGFLPGGRRPMPVPQGGGQTDDTGAFRLYGLPPGDYFVSARPSGFSQLNARLATGDSDQGFAPTYYPGTPSITDAQQVAIGVGQEVDGISFGLTPTRLSRISGRVIGWPSTRGMGFISATPDEGIMMGGMTGSGQLQPEGDFEMRSVPPGRWVLQVQQRGPRNGEELVGMTTVTVAGNDLTNVTITMQRPGTIRGRVDFEGGVPSTVRASQVLVYAEPVDRRPGAFVPGPPETADDFTFHARTGFGPVLLRVGGAAGWHLKAVEADGEDVTDSPMTVAPGTELTGVRVLLTQSVTKLTGSVRNDRGDAVLDAVVVVFPDVETRWTFGSRFIRSTRPDTEGRYELTALPPSNGYRIVAVPSLEDGQAYDPDFLTSVHDSAERLSLTAGETKAVDLRLRP